MSQTKDAEDKKPIDFAAQAKEAVDNAKLEAKAEDEKALAEEDEDDKDLDSEEEGSDKKDEESADDDSEDDTSDDDEEDDDSEDDKEEPAERKFKNLAAETDAEYIDNLENAYGNSSEEAVRLNRQLGTVNRQVEAIIEAAGKDPDLEKKLMKVLGIEGGNAGSGNADDTSKGGDTSDSKEDPYLVDFKTQKESKNREEIQEILTANPEIDDDPKLRAKVTHWMKIFSDEEFAENKRLMGGGEAMEAAMRHLGIEDKRKKEAVSDGVKKLGAPARRTKARVKTPKKATGLSEKQLALAAKMGVSREIVEKHANK